MQFRAVLFSTLLCMAFVVAAPPSTEYSATDAPVGGYATGNMKCVDIELRNGKSYNEALQIIAQCPVVQGRLEYYCTTIDLNMCYMNFYGQIRPQYKGNLTSSCNNCVMASTVLSCDCALFPNQYPRWWQHTQVETNDVVTNANGILSCHEHPGLWCMPPPPSLQGSSPSPENTTTRRTSGI